MPPKSHKSTSTPSRQGSTPRLFPVLMIILTALSLVGLFHAVSAESSKDPAPRDRGPSKSRAVQDLKSIAPAGQPGGIGGSTETSSTQGWQQENNNLTTNNKVGINTTTPLSALHVKGDLTIEEGNVKGSRTPVNGSDLATREYVDGKVGGGGYPSVYTSNGSKYLGKFLGLANNAWQIKSDGGKWIPTSELRSCIRGINGNAVVATPDGGIHILQEETDCRGLSLNEIYYSDSQCNIPITAKAIKVWNWNEKYPDRKARAMFDAGFPITYSDGRHSVTCDAEEAYNSNLQTADRRTKIPTKTESVNNYYKVDNGICTKVTDGEQVVYKKCDAGVETLVLENDWQGTLVINKKMKDTFCGGLGECLIR